MTAAAGRAGGWPLWPVAAALAIGWAVIGWPWLLGRVTVPWDAKAHFLPQIQFLAGSIARGEWPFWTPFVFAGHPQVADPQSMLFSPPFLLLALVNGAPSLRAVDATVLVMILAASLALMLWFRDRGWHWAGALIAALAFGFGASMAWRIQHIGQVLSLAYLPVALLCLDRALARGSVPWGVAAGVVAGVIALGRDQVALLGLYLLAGYVLWTWATAADPRAAASRGLAPVVAGGVAALALIAAPVFLTAMLAADSNRPAIDLEGAGRGSLHPALLLTWFAPDVFGASGRMEDYWGPPSFAWNDTGLYIAQNMGQLYIGAVPMTAILVAAMRGLLWDREIRFFTLATGVMLLYALGWYTPVFAALHTFLPGVDLFRRPADATFLIGGLTAVLAGYSIHRLVSGGTAGRSPSWREALTWLVVAGALAVGWQLGVRLDRVERAMPQLVIAGAWFLAAGVLLYLVGNGRLRPAETTLAALAALTIVDIAWNNGPSSSSALPPATYEMLEPDTRNETIAALKRRTVEGMDGARRDRVELVGLGFHWPNASLTHGLENTLGYNPVRIGLYSRATGAEDHVGLPGQRKFSPLFPSYRSMLADLLGLRWIASSVPIEQIDKRLQPGDLRLDARTRDGYIYENPRALPRALFATRILAADFDRLLADGRWPQFDPRDTLLLERPDSVGAERGPGLVRIVSYSNNEVVVEAESPDGGWVVLNDVWHPWWNAEVDGRAAVLERANVLFRAVEVRPGKRFVRFVFRPLTGALDQLMRHPAAASGDTSAPKK